MKKLITVLLCCMMLCSSLSAFAEDGIMPLIDCDHSGQTISTPVTEQRGCCTYVSYDEISCAECGKILGEENVDYGTNNVHVGGKTTYLEEENGKYYNVTYCKGCGEVLKKELVQMR